MNGAFGAGKTSTARELLDLIPGSTLYDPELIGNALRAQLPEKRLGEVDDYQDLPSWRRLVVDTAAALLMEVGGPLLAPMSLLRQEYRDEIFGGLAARRIPVRHMLLHAEETILRARIQHPDAWSGDPETGAEARAWRLARLPAYQTALPWLTRDAHVIDTGDLTPRQAAERAAAAVCEGAGACGIVQTPEPTGETLAAGVLLFDDHDRVLLVDPTYKPGWEFPGGVVERGEPPTRAAAREVAEELGLELGPGHPLRLLVMDWEPPRPPRFGGLRLLFDGGHLPAPEAARLFLPAAELRAWRFVTESEAATLLPAERFARLNWALTARRRGGTLMLEAGVPIG
nr:NUDIX hydrolase [Streptomyces sp. SID5468]